MVHGGGGEGRGSWGVGSPREWAKGEAGEGAGGRPLWSWGADKTGQGNPKKSLKSSPGFSRAQRLGLLQRGGGEQSGQVCIVIVKMPPGKAGQRAILAAADSVLSAPSARAQRKNQNGFLPPCQDAKGRPPSPSLPSEKPKALLAGHMPRATNFPSPPGPLPHRRGLLNLSVKQKSDFRISLRCLQLPAY